MKKDKENTPAKQKVTDKENRQANSKSEVREGQGNSSILHDKSDTTDNAYPELDREDRQYKQQDEFLKKKSNKNEE
jgi:hypothetical protein